MYFKKNLISGAVAFATMSLSTVAFAVQVDVTKGNNLYYTGQVPSGYELIETDTELDAEDNIIQTIPNYFGHMLAIKDYPTVMDPYDSVKQKVGNGPDGIEDTADDEFIRDPSCPGPTPDDATLEDTNQTCYGTAPAVIELPSGTAQVYVSVEGTITDTEDATDLGAEGKVSNSELNGLADSGLIAMWVKAGTAGVGVLADTAALVTHRNDIEDSEGHDSNSFDGVEFMSTNQGFTPIPDVVDEGPEFLLSSKLGGTATGFYGAVTPPADATHLVLGYNTGRGSFNINDVETIGSFTVEIQDTDFIPGHQNPNVTIQATGATVNTDGEYEVTQGGSIAFSTSTPVLEDGATVGTTEWFVNGAVTPVSQVDTYTFDATDAGVFTVTYTLTDSADAEGSDEVTVRVLADDNTAPVAAFSATESSSDTKTYNFDASASSDADGDNLTYAWDFGDGNQGTGATATHTYASDATYTVTLTVTDDSTPNSASDTETSSVTVTTPVDTTSGGGGGGAVSLFFGLGLLLPAFVRRRMK